MNTKIFIKKKLFHTALTGVTSTDSQPNCTPAASNIFWTLLEISGPIPSPNFKNILSFIFNRIVYLPGIRVTVCVVSVEGVVVFVVLLLLCVSVKRGELVAKLRPW